MNSRVPFLRRAALVAIAFACSMAGARPLAQQPLDRLSGLPGVDTFNRMQDQLRQGPAFVSGALNVTWAADSGSLTYAFNGRTHRYDIQTRTASETGAAPAGRGGRGGAPTSGAPGRGAGGAAPAGDRPNPCPRVVIERGRQSACESSPDGSKKAYYRDRNLYLSAADGSNEVAITTDGNEQARIKNGVASWVYGEELFQTTAIWWSPDSTKVAFYRFDESRVKDFYLQLDQTQVQDSLDVEAYPKAGTDNPVADVLVYDVSTRTTTKLDVRDGKPFVNDVVGHYVYAMTWSADSRELRMNRTDRRQQTMEFIGCDSSTGRCRVIVREAWPTGWTENRPTIRVLTDGQRFVWASDRTGWRNYYLYDFSGRLIAPLTSHTGFDAGAIVKIDERAGVMFYMARDGDNFMKLQLHRVGLDGRGDTRLTDPAFTHSVTIAPDSAYFTDVYQTHDQAPATRLVSTSGTLVAELAKSDLTRFQQLGLRPVEMFTYKAADGQTTLFGTIAFPSTFDPVKRYATLISVYGGPDDASNTPSETFAAPSTTTEYGVLVVSLSSRAVSGRGRRALDSLYLRLGQTEVDDMALGVKALWPRSYFDRNRVGIYGTSYGAYVALLGVLRYPDVYAAASASSPVTDWRHYDTIYTERYMWLPQENRDGYDKGSAMTYATGLRGRLLIYYGTADNNVHPTNSLQLVQALTRAGKSFEVQVGPDAGHSSVSNGRMMEFFLENLIVRPERLRVN